MIGTLLAGLIGLAAQNLQSTAPGRGCPAGGDAVPCELRVFYDNRDGKVVPIRGSELPISRDRDVQVWVESWTQYGRQWPQDQAKYQLGTQRGCPGRFEISNITPHRWRVRTLSDDADRCDLEIRLVSPREVVRQLTPVWEKGAPTPLPVPPSGGAEAEFTARAIYQALLSREPEPSGLAAATADIRAGRVALVVDRMLASPEYAQLHRGWNPSQLLQAIYSGLLDRPADDQGVRSYQPRIARGDVRGVVLEILRSREFLDRSARRR